MSNFRLQEGKQTSSKPPSSSVSFTQHPTFRHFKTAVWFPVWHQLRVRSFSWKETISFGECKLYGPFYLQRLCLNVRLWGENPRNRYLATSKLEKFKIWSTYQNELSILIFRLRYWFWRMGLHIFIRHQFIRNLHVEGQKRTCFTKGKISKELFNFEYFYHCKRSRNRKLVPFLCSQIRMNCV